MRLRTAQVFLPIVRRTRAWRRYAVAATTTPQADYVVAAASYASLKPAAIAAEMIGAAGGMPVATTPHRTMLAHRLASAPPPDLDDHERLRPPPSDPDDSMATSFSHC